MGYDERHIASRGNDHNRIMIVTGVSASGKDFLLSEANRNGLIAPPIRTLSFGQELFRHLRSQYPQIKTRDDINTQLNSSELRQGILYVANEIVEKQPAILNTHVVSRQNDSIITNPDVDMKVRPLSYVYVWSEPGQIELWRSADVGRARRQESADEISLHQDIAVEVVRIIAEHTGASFTTLWNRPDNVTENLAKIEERSAGLV